MYWWIGVSWWWLVVFILAPDITILGYLINPKVGAYGYNLIHTYSLAIVLGLIGLILGHISIEVAGVILGCHIGMDRSFGFGLKYIDNFKHTHLDML
jgi:hypothetical protein